MNHRIYILDTLSGEEMGVRVFINGGLEITLLSYDGPRIKYLLEFLGHKNVTLECAENEEEQDFILNSLNKLWGRLACST